MTTEQGKDFIRHFFEASIAKDSTTFMDLMAPDFIAHVPGGPKNREGFVQHMNVFNVAFNDMQIMVLVHTPNR
jgi:ketosteroid isomerase-like protein